MNPIEELTARLVQQAEADMPRPLAVGKPETLGRGAGAPSVDDECEDMESLKQVAEGAIATAREQQARADVLHLAIAEALLAFARHEPWRTRALLEYALDNDQQSPQLNSGLVLDKNK